MLLKRLTMKRTNPTLCPPGSGAAVSRFRNNQLRNTMQLHRTVLALLLAASCSLASAEEVYYVVPLNSLKFSDGQLPANFEWSGSTWQKLEALQPYAVLDTQGEAYV